MTDVEIVQRCLGGDVASFRVLVERYHHLIFGMIFHMTRDHHLSEDLCQDVFLDVYRQLASFDPARARFSTWLYRIAQNKTLNALKRKRPVFLAELPETAGPGGGYHDIELRELHTEMNRALDQLPENQRIAFVWAEIEQLSYGEIAQIEGATISAIKSRINRARQKIQDVLAGRQPHRHEPA